MADCAQSLLNVKKVSRYSLSIFGLRTMGSFKSCILVVVVCHDQVRSKVKSFKVPVVEVDELTSRFH